MKHNIISKLSGFNKSVKVRLVILLHEYLSDGPGLLLTLHGQNNCNDILMIINYFRTMPNDELLQEIDDKVDNEESEEAVGPADLFDNSVEKLLIKNCSIVTDDGMTTAGDILIEDGVVKEVGTRIENEDGGAGVKIIDANAGFLTVGGINIINSAEEDEDNYLSSGVSMTLHTLSFVSGVNIIETVARMKTVSQTNFSFMLQLNNINELSRSEVQVLVEQGDINTISFTATRLNNTDLITALKQIKHYKCAARLMMDKQDLINHFSRLGINPGYDEEVETSQVRRLCTIVKQVGVVASIGRVHSTEALNVIREFSDKIEIFAELADDVGPRVRKHVEMNKSLQNMIIMRPTSHIINLSSFIKMCCHNPARMIRMKMENIAVGSLADLVLWRKQEDIENDSTNKYKADVVIVNGQVGMKQEGEVNPHSSGQFMGLNRVEIVEEQEDVKHVEREKINDGGDNFVNGNNQKITIDAAGVTSLDQVPKMFQRRVSAFGVRNQQDSSFCLTDPDADLDPEHQHQSLTGSRRASVKLHAPPGGLSSGFW